jgi:predicted pyridoxine 5'-phosphate oxidase superfamily flavin-nucleotide-binding protein
MHRWSAGDDDLIAFIEDMDSFFIGTASHDGWPHVQHRGGPPGFLKVLDERWRGGKEKAKACQMIS